MGLYDRDYMRSPRRAAFGVPGSWSIRVLLILGAAYLLQRIFDPPAVYLGLSWDLLARGQVWRLLTAALAHADVMHLLMNLIGLFFFGRLAEQALGQRDFARFCLGTAIAAHIPYVAFQAVTGAQSIIKVKPSFRIHSTQSI